MTHDYWTNRFLMEGIVVAADEHGVQVMLIEDDVVLRRAIGSVFRSSGVEVLAESGDGAEALEVLAETRVDLIVTDCQMPRMDGISLVRQLRARGDFTPVIMVSGQVDPLVIERARAAGVNCYLPKPLSAESLWGAIGQTLPGWAA
ncbi:N/A [soil metagenome]